VPCLPCAAQDKTQTIALLQDNLKRTRVSLEALKRSSAAELAQKLAQQKAVYEESIQRNLTFIDKLLAEKQALTSKVDELSGKLDTVDSAWQSRLRSFKERAAVELKRAQDTWAAAEKVRRDTWIHTKEKAIKEATVKGLEPELQRILERHRGEMERVRSECEQRVERERQDVAARHADELARCKLSVDAKVLEAVDREKRLLLDRERDMRTQFEAEVKDIRGRCSQDSEAEQRRHTDAMREERARHADEVARLRASYEDRIDALLRREEAERLESGARVSSVIAEEQKVGDAQCQVSVTPCVFVCVSAGMCGDWVEGSGAACCRARMCAVCEAGVAARVAPTSASGCLCVCAGVATDDGCTVEARPGRPRATAAARAAEAERRTNQTGEAAASACHATCVAPLHDAPSCCSSRRRRSSRASTARRERSVRRWSGSSTVACALWRSATAPPSRTLSARRVTAKRRRQRPRRQRQQRCSEHVPTPMQRVTSWSRRVPTWTYKRQSCWRPLA
jgi:hypothetical protein